MKDELILFNDDGTLFVTRTNVREVNLKIGIREIGLEITLSNEVAVELAHRILKIVDERPPASDEVATLGWRIDNLVQLAADQEKRIRDIVRLVNLLAEKANMEREKL